MRGYVVCEVVESARVEREVRDAASGTKGFGGGV